MRKDSSKSRRVNAEVMKELSSIVRELKDPRIAVMTSLTDVIVAPDLKTAKVYVSVLGTPEEEKQTLKGIESAKGFIRHELAVRMNMRNTPELTFVADESIRRGVEMSKKITEVIAHDEEVSRQTETEDEAFSGEDTGEEDELS